MTVWTASEMGKKGGRSRSPRKLAAIRKNAEKAGRPRDLNPSPEALYQRARRDKQN